MVVSIRATGVVCLGFLALTAAAPAPDATPASPPTLSASATTEAPAYFLLTDQTNGAAAMPDTGENIADESAPDDVSARRDTASLSADERCVAAAVYYESRGEPLAGQMAVAQVILNRVRSGRFADTPCGVVRQPGQFSFARRTFAPPPSADWRKAVAVARVAMAGGGASQMKSALYFHASYVAPGWDKAAMATIGRHVFYR